MVEDVRMVNTIEYTYVPYKISNKEAFRIKT